MEKDYFIYHAVIMFDDLPPSFEGWYNPHQRWNGWYAILYLMKKHLIRFVPTTDPKTNKQEDIDDLKEFMDKETAKSRYSVSMEGQLYDFGSLQ